MKRELALAAFLLAACGDSEPDTSTGAGTTTATGTGTGAGAVGGAGGGNGVGGGGGGQDCGPPAAATVDVRVYLRHMAGHYGLGGATIKACAPADLECSCPQDSATTSATGKAYDGSVVMKVPLENGEWRGYFEASLQEAATVLLYSDPITKSGALWLPLETLDEASVVLGLDQLGLHTDPDRGVIGSLVQGLGAEGGRFEVDGADGESIEGYCQSQMPPLCEPCAQQDCSETPGLIGWFGHLFDYVPAPCGPGTRSTARGQAVFANIPTGLTKVRWKDAESEEVLLEREVVVRPFGYTVVGALLPPIQNLQQPECHAVVEAAAPDGAAMPVWRITATADEALWTAGSTGVSFGLFRRPLDGGVQTLLETDVGIFVLHGDMIYWVDVGVVFQVHARPVDGAPFTGTTLGPFANYVPSSMAVDDDRLYVCVPNGSSSFDIRTFSFLDASVQTLATAEGSCTTPHRIVAAGDVVAIASVAGSDQTLKAFDKNTGLETTLAGPFPTNPWRTLVADGDRLLWAGLSIPLDGTPPTALYDDLVFQPTFLDGSHIYGCYAEGLLPVGLGRIDLDGANPELMDSTACFGAADGGDRVLLPSPIAVLSVMK